VLRVFLPVLLLPLMVPVAPSAEPVTRAESLAEAREKLGRVNRFLKDRNLGGVLLTQVRNFSWVTAGLGDNHVVITADAGAASLLIMDDGHKYVIASNSEMARLVNEDLSGLGYEPREFKWYEDKIAQDSKLAIIREIARGRRIGSDVPYADLPVIDAAFAPLRYPLIDSEIRKFRWLGRNSTEAVIAVCRKLKPGVTERELEAMASDELMRRGIRPTVLLMGTDDRQFRFKHPVPSEKRLEKFVFVNVCARKWGLAISTGRFVHFGPLPEEWRKRFNLSARINAELLARSKPGVRAGELFELAKKLYAENGYPGEEQDHHMGGAIGYTEREWVAVPGSPEVIHDRQGMAWNAFVKGCLSFDTFVVYKDHAENVSGTPDWPAIEVKAGGAVYRLPDVWVREK
jgi:Xaa-Pro dipeptidase